MEKSTTPISGYIALLIQLALLVLPILLLSTVGPGPLSISTSLIMGSSALIMINGFFFVNPNSSRVLVLFGTYKGTVKNNGFFWVNPFYTKQKISLRARNFDSEKIKVNDLIGNPILISVILVWKVRDTFKAAFDIDNYQNFVNVQTDAAVRKLAMQYPYDNFDDDQKEVTLRSGLDEVNEALEHEMEERLSIAGIEVMEARIGYLAYAQEIAQAMLKRQQATAIVAARLKIVEGAVGMVETALEELSAKKIIELDDDKKAAMVSNLMVVLCSDKDTSPVINTGTLYN